MRYALLAAALLLIPTGAYAAESNPFISAAPFYRNSDNPMLDDGVGFSVEIGTNVESVEGLSVGLELNHVSQDLTSPFGNLAFGDVDTLGLFGNVSYDVIEHDKINVALTGGIGFLKVDTDSSISGLSLDADNTLALKAGAEWSWNIHKGDGSDNRFEGIDISVFGEATYMSADTDVEISSGGPALVAKEQDLDATDVKIGIKILI